MFWGEELVFLKVNPFISFGHLDGLGGGVREVDDNDHDQDNDDYEENYHDETLMIKIIMTIMMITMTITVPGLQGRRS